MRGRSNSDTLPPAMFTANASCTACAASGPSVRARGALIFTSSCMMVFSLVELSLPAAQGVDERDLQGEAERRRQRGPHVVLGEDPLFPFRLGGHIARHLAHERRKRIGVVVLADVLREFGGLERLDHALAAVERARVDFLRQRHRAAIHLHGLHAVLDELRHQRLFQFVEPGLDSFQLRVEIAFPVFQAHELFQLLHVHCCRSPAGYVLISARIASTTSARRSRARMIFTSTVFLATRWMCSTGRVWPGRWTRESDWSYSPSEKLSE